MNDLLVIALIAAIAAIVVMLVGRARIASRDATISQLRARVDGLSAKNQDLSEKIQERAMALND